ncbi:kanadaptin [Eurosta solidaginis]|uniref:kanadaptin n=1 Tax=Eurosta solidaginis TaxID=178769 RepID=UPI0035311796
MEDFKVPLLPTAGVIKAVNEQEKKICKPTLQSGVNNEQKPSPVNTTTIETSVCPYKVPPWSQTPPDSINFKFEVLKSGQIIDEIENLQTQAIWKFGRLPPPANDIELAHPTISRYHAILQYRPKKQIELANTESAAADDSRNPPEGWYIYDLNSTHGTFLNKQRIPPNIFIRIRVGHIMRLGASTRSYILQGPQKDEEPESELTVTELREQYKQKLAEAEAEAIRKSTEADERERNEGISWGMAEDADEETDLSHNPYASTNNEELFLDDPKKTLRGYFEREGLELAYKCDEMSVGSFVCRVELPIDDAYGRPIIAEVVHKGRKKECVVQCALEACRILDRHGVLRQANQEPLKRKAKTQSDSDEDDFLDRTGDVERKKQRKSNPPANTALTYEDLLNKDADISAQILQVEDNIKSYQETQRRLKSTQDSNMEDLDDFMDSLTSDVANLDKTEIRKLRLEEQRLKYEKERVQRLIKIAKPVNLKLDNFDGSTNKAQSAKKQLPMIGKRNQFSKFKIAKIVEPTEVIKKANVTNLASDEEEFEEDEEGSTATRKSVLVKSAPTENSEKNEGIPELPVQELNSTSKIYGPAGLVSKNLVTNEEEKLVENTSQSTLKQLSNKIEKDEVNESENLRKKRRQRQRLRQKRQGIDLDELEEHESSEKYAKWVPPPNQSGDGYTELNKKYGY